jgi:hypothetical protein
MSLRNPGTIELNLTPGYRKEYNEVLRQFAAFLDKVEQELAARNLPGSMRTADAPYAYAGQDDLPADAVRDGIYVTEGAGQMSEYWWRRFDRYNFAHGIHEELPALETLHSLTGTITVGGAGTAAAGPGAAGPPRRPAGPGGPGVQRAETPFDVVVRVLLAGIEPWRVVGHLMSPVYDQPHVRRLLSHVDPRHAEDADPLGNLPGAGAKQFLAVTREKPIAPTFAKYLDAIDEVLEKDQLAEKLLSPANVARREMLRGMVHRTRLSLVLLLGHRSQAAVDEYPGLFALGVPFTLPDRVIITPRFLPLLLNAVPRDTRGELPEHFWSRLEGGALPDIPTDGTDSGPQAVAAIATMAEKAGSDSHLILRFVCCGPSGRLADRSVLAPGASKPLDGSEAKQEGEKYAPEEPDYCGWYPKADPTHPVVLIGSPGTSKTTLMHNGMVTLWDNIQAMRAVIRFRSDRDAQKYLTYVDRYWDGDVPLPTTTGTRDSIHLRVEATDDPSYGAEFVFTDIPGELVSNSVLGQGTDPYVLAVLKHAETIVFLFDPSIEPAVQQRLRFSRAQKAWKTLIRNYEQVLEDRKEAAAAAKDGGKATAAERDKAAEQAARNVRVIQFELLEKMIDDLTQVRGALGQDTGPNFLCVIPKADLYAVDGREAKDDKDDEVDEADEAHPDTRFLTGYFEYLRNNGILSVSPAGPQGLRGTGFEWYRSQAGYGAHLANGTPMPEDRGIGPEVVNWQLKLAAEVSSQAREHLSRFGNALGAGAEAAERDSLGDLIRWRLIERLESVFGLDRVFFLPVSAQGADLKVDKSGAQMAAQAPAGDGARKLGHPPNSKMAEYAFIVPIALALRAQQQ